MSHLPPRKIVVAVDLSQPSLWAWAQASRLASRLGARLEAVHVRELAPALTMTSPRFERVLASERKALESSLRAAVGREARLLIQTGDPAVTLLRLARTRKPDLIVIGTHGRKPLGRLVLGSVAESVVLRSPVPVMVVRSAPRALGSILAPVNFTPYADLAFDAAAALAAALKLPLTLLHVAESLAQGPNARFEIESMLARLPAGLPRPDRLQVLVRAGEPCRVILAEAKRHALVVLAAHRKGDLKDFVLGSTAARILRASPVPVLAIPDPRKVAPSRRDWAGWVAGR